MASTKVLGLVLYYKVTTTGLAWYINLDFAHPARGIGPGFHVLVSILALADLVGRVETGNPRVQYCNRKLREINQTSRKEIN